MEPYLDLIDKLFSEGEEREDRTGTGVLSVFGAQKRYDISHYFPLLTTKKVHFHSVVHELLWFLKGETNIRYLKENRVNIWDQWADKEGELGPIYGYQWRRWNSPSGTIDQMREVIEGIKKNPFSRRHIVSAWNPADINRMALPPCHLLFQFYVSKSEELSCHLYQRSGDLFLGVPFNIASYSLLTWMIAHLCKLKPKWFIHTFGDLHLYKNHIEAARLQRSRIPRKLPTLILNPSVTDIDQFRAEEIEVLNYEPHPTIKAEISI